MLGTVDKAGRVLELFTSRQPEWGVSEVARQLEMPKSSAHSLLSALASNGLLTHTEDNRYRLGWRLLNLSRTLLNSSALLPHARATLAGVSRQYGVTAQLAVLHDGAVTYLYRAAGSSDVPATRSSGGGQLPAHATALGKSLLAFAPPARLHDLVANRGLARFTDRTVTSPDVLAAELQAVRARGWSRADQELVEGLRCYAAPVFGFDQRVEAAVSVSVGVAEDDLHPERYSRIAQAAALAITRRLRAPGPSWGAAGGDQLGAAAVAA